MNIFPKNKKGGLVGDIVNGTGGLIIGVIITLVIVSTLLGADLLTADSTYDVSADNMAANFTEGLDNVSEKNSNYSIDCSGGITFRSISYLSC